MLRKIISIKNVGRFLSYGATDDVVLKRYNLIFAENGRGKTTTCAILRSLQSGDPAHILGRATLGATGQPEIQVLLDGDTASFVRGGWTATMANLAVFDSTFISDNVYSGDAVGLQQRRGLHGVIVGSRGRQLAMQVDQLDTESRERNPEIREKAAAVQALAPPDMSVDAFAELANDPDVDAKIAAAERQLEAVRQVDQIGNRPALSEVILPALPDGLRALLGKTLEGVARDAEERVARQIQAHDMHPPGQTWLVEGVGYIRDEACPFCGQDLRGLELIAAYRACFGEAYAVLREEIEGMRGRVDDALSDRAAGATERILDQNVAGTEFWSRYAEIAPPVLVGREGITETVRTLRQSALALLQQKGAAPLEPLTEDSAFEEALAALEATRASLGPYNEAVRTANAAIAARKTAAGAVTIREAEAAVVGLRAVKKRHEPDGVAVCRAYYIAVLEKARIDDRKAEVKGQLDDYSQDVIERYEQSINRLLEDFGAGFRLAGTAHDYVGGPPRSTYQIVINGASVGLGDPDTPLGRPSFRNTLSSGDRSTLALAFFLAQLEHDPDRAATTVVFDDPFNSQDGFRKDWTAQKIKECGDACAQVIVLSHDPFFLKRVWDRLPGAERKCLELKRIGLTNTTICPWDIEKATETRFNADRKTLTDYHNGIAGNLRDVVQKVRPVLETYCKLLGGGTFAENDSLGDIVGKLRAAGPGHQLYPILNELDGLNMYTRRYYHGENLNAATEPITDGELQAMVRRTLMITGGC